jgi:hypothetical protein
MEAQFRKEKGIDLDMRRNFATVVIGHPCHNSATANESLISSTIRTYNSHLSRVEVITYDELFTSALRALDFEEEGIEQAVDDATEEPAAPWAVTPPPAAGPASTPTYDPWAAPITDPWATPPTDPRDR